jgi:thiol:disulfide interchange protein
MKYLKKFSAIWCQPCRALKTVTEQINFPEHDIDLEEIDIDSITRMKLQELGVKGVPTMILYDDKGNELSRKTGAMSVDQLETWLGIKEN